jgi:copper resistance protein B
MTRQLRLIGAAVILVLAWAMPARAQQPPPPPPPPPTTQPPPVVEDHSAHMAQAAQVPKEPIPPITDADRAAAFPAGLDGHEVHDQAINFMVLFDQLEWRGRSNGGLSWENTTWIGGDINRLWLRVEGEAERGRVEHASGELLWGRSVSRWWDVVAGISHDRPGPAARTWAAIGLQGLAPQWFEVEVTGYVGPGGRTRLRAEVEYEVLITNRWILQPLIEADLYGKADPARGIGAGLSSLETGARLRYVISPELAPYIGLTWERALFGTADLARAHGDRPGRTRFTVGVRAWF